MTTQAAFDELAQDLRFAARTLSRSPLFAAVAVVSLALGIGANTALFSFVNTLLLEPLPYKDAGRLMYVSEFWPHEPAVPGPPNTDLSNWRLKSKLVEQFAAYGGGADALTLTGAGEPERIQGTMSTSGLLELIGTRMALGRDFTQDEDRVGGPPAAILSYALWQSKFASSPEVIGKQIRLDGSIRTIVGVLPSGFEFPDNNFRGDLLVPMQMAIDPNWHDDRNFRLVRVIARSKPGAGEAAVQAELSAIVRQTASQEPPQFAVMRKDMEVRVSPLRDWLTGGVRRMVLVLEAAVAMLLLIACLNIAGLQVARASSRRKEMAVRAAVGAARGRLIRQLLTESVLLAGLGGAAGLAFGYWSLTPLRAFLPANVHLADGIRVDPAVLWFTLAIAVAAGIVSGISPALAASRPNLQEAIKDGRSSAPARQRMHDLLVVAEIAAGMVLLVGSGLLVRTFIRLASADPGFQPGGVLTLRIALPERAYPDTAAWTSFFGRLLERAQAIPGVESAAISSGLPVVGTRSAAGVSIEGETPPPLGGRPSIPVANVSPDYFHALGIPFLRGRQFTAADANGPRVAIVNQAFAGEFFPGQDAIGKRIEFGSRRGLWSEIVGVTGNVTQHAWGPADRYIVYSPTQDPQNRQMFLILKSARTPPQQLAGAATAAVHEIDPNQPVFDVATMEERLGVVLAPQRANMTLMSAFAALALLLSAIGICGVIACFVNQRKHEIGIRLALGARRSAVLKIVLGRGLALTFAGLALGIAGSLLLTRALGAMLVGVKASDPAAYSAAVALFLLVAGAACWIPARSAARVDPATILKSE